jgi:hypothetical protein
LELESSIAKEAQPIMSVYLYLCMCLQIFYQVVSGLTGSNGGVLGIIYGHQVAVL